ncbi:MAG: AbgT family transporter [Lachnospiraceae bacterium]|nr:AbgT family transporter [Lachnospiraceae bacterium]
MPNTTKKRTWLDAFLDGLEKVCNKLPVPAIMFIYLFGVIAVISCILSLMGVSAVNPATNELVAVQNPISSEGLLWLIGNLVKNFTGFAPLGLVITMTLAIGMCEESGLIVALLNDKLRNISPRLLPYIVAFVGVCGNIASDTAMVVIPPIAAILYIAAGKHPVVGMINGYAGAQAGFSANLMIAGTDSLLQGITNTVLDGFLGEGVYHVDVTCNWFFMFASTFLCAAVIGAVCNLIVDKRFGEYVPGEDVEVPQLEDVTPEEKKGLKKAGIAVLIYLILVIIGYFFGPLAKINEDGSRAFVGSPLLSGLIPILFFFFVTAGLTYGISTGKFKNSKDVNKAMVHQMTNMGSYVVFCFFCGQFNALFNWTKLGTVIAIGGADFLAGIGLTGFGLLVGIILMTGFINLLVPSGSAKWAILAPIFVPMLMLLGYHPGFIQLLYRLGDSPTNAFTPLSSYIWVTLAVAQQKYDKELEIGTLAAGLFPIAIVLQIAWIIFLAIYMATGLPIGPGVGFHLPAGIL